MKPSLYEKFAADYEKDQQERVASFNPAPAGDTPPPAGTYPQQTAERQDQHAADRMERAATGSEPESTRFAGGRAFGESMGKSYEELDRMYGVLSGTRRSAYPSP